MKEARVSADRAGLPNGKGSLIAAFYQTGPVPDGAGYVAAVDKACRIRHRRLRRRHIGETLDLLIRRVLELSVC